MGAFKSSVFATLAIGLLAGSAASVTAQDAEPVTTDVASGVALPGPLGRSYADWASEWAQWVFSQPDLLAIDCGLGDRGGVHFVPVQAGQLNESPLECTVRSDQHVFLAPVLVRCPGVDARLEDRQFEAESTDDDKRYRQLRKRLRPARAEAHECTSAHRPDSGSVNVFDPLFVALDGEELDIDERFFINSTPFVLDGERRVISGYFIMLEPLALGDHEIEMGTAGPAEQGLGFRSFINLEVVGAAE